MSLLMMASLTGGLSRGGGGQSGVLPAVAEALGHADQGRAAAEGKGAGGDLPAVPRAGGGRGLYLSYIFSND